MKTPIIRYTGSPDSDPESWLRINNLETQPGPGSAYRVTIEEMDVKLEPSLIEALEEIAAWDSHTPELAVAKGSNGVRDFYRDIALSALAKSRGPL